MGEKEANIKNLVQKIDELLNVLKVITSDLSAVSNSLKKVNKPTTSVLQTSIVEKKSKIKDIKDVKEAFSSELRDMLLFEKTGNYIIVKPKRFLGSDNFARIASIVRELEGEYISAGRNSHFKISYTDSNN